MRCFRLPYIAGLVLISTIAEATFHTYRIESVYSNADGTVQYIVLRETQGMVGQRFKQSVTLLRQRACAPSSRQVPATFAR